MPETLDNALREIQRARNVRQLEKTAAVRTEVDFNKVSKVAYSEAGPLLQNCIEHGLGVFEAANGHIWRLSKEADGGMYLIRDETMTSDTEAIIDLMAE
jgi:hypothetical protein